MEDFTREKRYRIFLSYRSEDRALAEWLHKELELFRTPRALVGAQGEHGPIPARLAPVFRDRDDSRTAMDIETTIAKFLRNSEQLVVLCTPAARHPKSWVPREIELFKRDQPTAQIHAVLGAGEPHDAVPEPLLTRSEDGSTRMPWVADLRPVRDGGDGRRKGLVKLLAGLLGVEFDVLWKRELRRRWARLALSVSVAVAFCLAALYVAAVDRSFISAQLIEEGRSLVPNAVDSKAAKEFQSEALGISLLLTAYELSPGKESLSALMQAERWKYGLRSIYEVDLSRDDIARSLTNREAMAISGDGNVAVAAFTDGRVQSCNQKNCRNLRQVISGPTAVAVDRQGKCISVGDLEGRARAFPVSSQSCTAMPEELTLTHGPVISTTVDGSRGLVAAGGTDFEVAARGKEFAFLEKIPAQDIPATPSSNCRVRGNFRSAVTALKFVSQQEQLLLVAGTHSGEIWIKQLSTADGRNSGQWARLSESNGQCVFFIETSNDGTKLAVSGDNQGIRLFDFVTMKQIAEFSNPADSSIGGLTVSDNGSIYFGTWNGKLREAHLESGSLNVVRSFPSHKKGIVAVGLDEQLGVLSVWSMDGSLRKIDLAKRTAWFTGQQEISANSLIVDREGIHAKDINGSVSSWDRNGRKILKSIPRDKFRSKQACATGGRTFRASPSERGLLIESLDKGQWKVISATNVPAKVVTFSRDCAMIVTAGGGTVRAYRSEQLAMPLWSNNQIKASYQTYDVVFAADGSWVAVALDEGVQFLSGKTGRPLAHMLDGNGNAVSAIAEDEKEKLLYAATGGRIEVLPTPDGVLQSNCQLAVHLRRNEEDQLTTTPGLWHRFAHYVMSSTVDKLDEDLRLLRSLSSCSGGIPLYAK